MCRGAQTLASWPRSRPARPVTSALAGPPPATAGSTGTCAGHCSASAPQCPATERRSPVHHPPPPASVLANVEPRGTVAPPSPHRSAGSTVWPGRHHRAASWSTTAVIPGPRAALVRRALLRQGSAMPGFSPGLVGQRCCESQRFACISQSAGALSPKTRLASHRAGGLACALASPPSRAPRPCAGPRPIVASWPSSRPARPVTSALAGPPPATAGSTGTCAGHCSASAPQCPATETATPVHHPPRPRPLKSLHPKNSPRATTPAATPIRMRPSPLRLFMRCRPHDI
jgi:hypothetical protein